MQGEKTYKVVLLGDSFVGKTSLISRFVKNVFTEAYVNTVGAAFATKSIRHGHKDVRLNLWDTAGQERYRALTNMFYKDAQAAILVYDITSLQSFRSLQSWVEQVTEKGPAGISER